MDFNLGEVTTHITDTGTGNTLSTSYMINLDRWNELDPAVQEIMTDAVTELIGDFEEVYVTPWLDSVCAKAEDHGIELSIWSDDAKEEWSDLISDVLYDNWATAAEAAGVEDPAGEFERFESHIRDLESESIYGTEVSYCIEKNGS